jgi:acyl-CoA synthetase (AMP-forming)/AMP-acid ligase II
MLQDHLPFSFTPAARTLPALLTAQAERFAAKRLFSCSDTSWTYAQARDMAAGMAGTLSAAGLGAEDRIALMC